MKKFSPPQMKEVSFPTPHTPHPTPYTPLPHFPTSHTLFLNKKIISPELNRDVFLRW